VAIATGKILWTAPVRAETLAAPAIDKGVVYLESGADVVYALDAETGKQLWLYNRQVTTSLSIRATTRPVVSGEIILAGFSDGFIVALKKRDGSLLWERKLGKAARFRDVDATPVVDGQDIYVASFDTALYSLKLETGEINWTVNEGAYVPVTLGQGQFSDRIFYATASGSILMIDRATGKVLKTLPVDQGIATQPVQYKNLLVYGESAGAFVVADPESGATLAKFFPGEGLVSSPTLVEGSGESHFYFISSAANLYALKLSYRRASDRLPWRKDY
jgi:outer membrane protein assembly factor BamB